MCAEDIVDIGLWANTAVQTAVTAIREAEAISRYVLPGEAPFFHSVLLFVQKKILHENTNSTNTPH